MSLNYASSLSPYSNKGKCGLPEKFDSIEDVHLKCKTLADLINNCHHIVVLTGAGISTSSGIPDFRGPNGVWTLEKKGKQPEHNVSFENAKPSYSHYALVELNKIGKLSFLITQNIDGLHMRSGFPIDRLAELHGNMFVEKCHSCLTKYLNNKCVEKIGLKPTGKKCKKNKAKGNCRGDLHDTILDWEDALPVEEFQKSEMNCKKADLCICLGTTLQIMPVGNFPLLTKKNNGKIVIVNLQSTRIDNSADLIINSKLDFVFEILMEKYFNIFVETNKICINKKAINDDDKKNKMFLNVSDVVIDQAYFSPSTECQNKEKSIQEKNLISKTEEKKIQQPHLILIISGKRKSGKDFICQKLIEMLKEESLKFKIFLSKLNYAIKEEYAIEHGLNFQELLNSNDNYFQMDLINWSDKKRSHDPFHFCSKAVENISERSEFLSTQNCNIWIISDVTHKSDLLYFETHFPSLLKTVLITADESIRIKRNCQLNKDFDNLLSESDLDSKKNWDFVINNNEDHLMNKNLADIIDYLKKLLEILKL